MKFLKNISLILGRCVVLGLTAAFAASCSTPYYPPRNFRNGSDRAPAAGSVPSHVQELAVEVTGDTGSAGSLLDALRVKGWSTSQNTVNADAILKVSFNTAAGPVYVTQFGCTIDGRVPIPHNPSTRYVAGGKVAASLIDNGDKSVLWQHSRGLVKPCDSWNSTSALSQLHEDLITEIIEDFPAAGN